MAKLKHPTSGTVVDVSDDRADVLRSRGYTDAASSGAGPTASDNKATWVDHAVSQGADRDDAEAMTKADLMAKYGS